MPLINVAFMTLLQRRTPQAIMGRVSAAVEVVMGAPQAISLAVGSMLVVVLSYRTILGIMGAATLVAAAYIVVMLRHRIIEDVRGAAAGLPAGAPDLVLPADTGTQVGTHAGTDAGTEGGIVPTAPVEP
jgi:hypothetical protein